MGTHPNAMIMAVLTVDQGSRKTERMIFEYCQKNGVKTDADDKEIRIPTGERGHVSEQWPEGYPITCNWSVKVMESDYDEGYQISADEGQIVFHTFLTYGYGEKISWERLEAIKNQIEDLLEPMSKPLQFSYEIFIGANYW